MPVQTRRQRNGTRRARRPPEQNIVCDNEDRGSAVDIRNQPKFFQFSDKDKLSTKKGNWKAWKVKTVAILKRYRCYNIITGDRERPIDNVEEGREWDKLQTYALQHTTGILLRMMSKYDLYMQTSQ